MTNNYVHKDRVKKYLEELNFLTLLEGYSYRENFTKIIKFYSRFWIFLVNFESLYEMALTGLLIIFYINQSSNCDNTSRKIQV